MAATDYSRLRGNINELVDGITEKWIAAHPRAFDDLADYLNADDSKPGEEAAVEIEGESDMDEASSDENAPGLDPRLKARNRIRRTIVSHSESIATGTRFRDKVGVFVLDHLRSEGLDETDMTLIGHLNLALKPSVFRLNNFNAYLRAVPRSFDSFRKAEFRHAGRQIYSPEAEEAIKTKKIDVSEADILIFTMLRLVGSIIRFPGRRLEQDLNREILRKVMDQYRTQIAVDEATDFSAVQLASIYYLTDPEFRSATFSGDLMQRVTTKGLTSWLELEELIPSIETYELVASYRQTPTLLNVAKKLYETIIGEKPSFDSKYSSNGTFPQPLKYHGEFNAASADWMAERIFEIYRINGDKLPSIAVFVPTENHIDQAQELLSEALNKHSIDVEPCRKGQVLGTGSNVRIFSIEYIKGLEFEGVFYVDIDKVYQNNPNLVDKYLYVGLTRATTFLGVTHSDAFPFEFLSDDFRSGNWSDFL